jgi:hypothetical protein
MSPVLLLIVAVIYAIVGCDARNGLNMFYFGCAAANLGLAYDSISHSVP